MGEAETGREEIGLLRLSGGSLLSSVLFDQLAAGAMRLSRQLMCIRLNVCRCFHHFVASTRSRMSRVLTGYQACFNCCSFRTGARSHLPAGTFLV